MAPVPFEEHSVILEWNNRWEDVLSALDLNRVMPPHEMALHALTHPHNRLYILGQKVEICTVQKELFNLATAQFVTGNLQQRWDNMSQTEREKFSLDGLWSAAHGGPNFEKHRTHCPDISVRGLAGYDGHGFLQLVIQLMPDNLVENLTEPITLPHSAIDEMFKRDEERSGLDFTIRRLARCYFVTSTLWHIMIALVSAL